MNISFDEVYSASIVILYKLKIIRFSNQTMKGIHQGEFYLAD